MTIALASKIKGTVVVPGDEGYAAAIRRWAANAERNAAVVVQVTSSADVVEAIKYAKQVGLEIAISGGKHSVSGAASTDGGLVIDLCKMRAVRVDTEKNLIIAQGGCLWEDVDKAGAEHGLATVGGTVNDTGIGGLTLGGGYGYLSGQYGMVVDNLRNVEMVLASGEIVQANAEVNSDLFWAIRGGGCNFGVVTEFTYQAYPHPNTVYSGILAFTPMHLEALVDTLNAWYPNEGQNPKCAFLLTIGSPPPAHHPTLLSVIFYDGPEDEGRQLFKKFFDLGPVADMTHSHPYVMQNALLNPLITPGRNRYMKATALKHLTVPILKSMLDLYSEYRTTVGDESMESICLLEVFPRDAINSVPDSGTAFSNRGEWFNITLLPTWEKPEHAAYTRNWVHSVVDKVAALEKEDEMTKTGEEVVAKKGYWNGSMGDEKSSLVFGENYKRLREVKRKYDPELVFRKWFPIAPADW